MVARTVIHWTTDMCQIRSLYAGASSCYVALCTQLSPDAVQHIWGASCNQPHSNVLVCDHHLSTFPYRRQGPSSASGPFSYVGPSGWNTLPYHIHKTVDSASSRKLLKMHIYFIYTFGVVWFLQLFYLHFTFTLNQVNQANFLLQQRCVGHVVKFWWHHPSWHPWLQTSWWWWSTPERLRNERWKQCRHGVLECSIVVVWNTKLSFVL